MFEFLSELFYFDLLIVIGATRFGLDGILVNNEKEKEADLEAENCIKQLKRQVHRKTQTLAR